MRSIVQFKEVFLTPRYLAIAMEFVAGGDMFEYVVRKGGLKESEARWFFQQLIVGVDYLHRMVRSRLGCGRARLRRAEDVSAWFGVGAAQAERSQRARACSAHQQPLRGSQSACETQLSRKGEVWQREQSVSFAGCTWASSS